jgi:hypothetical protein
MGGLHGHLKNRARETCAKPQKFSRDCKIALAWPYQAYVMRAVSRDKHWTF